MAHSGAAFALDINTFSEYRLRFNRGEKYIESKHIGKFIKISVMVSDFRYDFDRYRVKIKRLHFLSTFKQIVVIVTS